MANLKSMLPSPRCQEYEIDFVSLSYTRTMDDVVEARDLLDSVGLASTKIFVKLETRQVGGAGGGPHHAGRCQQALNSRAGLNEAGGVVPSEAPSQTAADRPCLPLRQRAPLPPGPRLPRRCSTSRACSMRRTA